MSFRKRKGLAMLLIISLLMGMLPAYAYGEEDSGASTTKVFYVGGAGAADGNDGSSTSPFLTLGQAASAINSAGPGSYQIIMQGDTTETSQVSIGNGSSVFQVSITLPGSPISVSGSAITVSGSAITVSKDVTSGPMITVMRNASLTLAGKSDKEQLIFDGNSKSGQYALFHVSSGGTLNVNSFVSIQNNYNLIYTFFGKGAGIYNSGTLNLNGGIIQNNYNGAFGGAVYNDGTFIMRGGTISNNTASWGSGVYNNSNMTIHAGSIKNNGKNCILNYGTVTMYDGEITDNATNAVETTYGGTFTMNGGSISNNTSSVYSDFVAISLNSDGIFNFTGGSIANNNGATVAAINDGTFSMSGGLIDNSLAATVFRLSGDGSLNISDGEIKNAATVIDMKAPVTLGGNITISGKGDNQPTVNIDNTSKDVSITAAGDLSRLSSLKIVLAKYRRGSQIVQGTSLSAGLLAKFIIADPNLGLDNDGKLVFIGTPQTLYVDAAGSDAEDQDGSKSEPLLTIGEAVERIGNGKGTIIIQSDLDVAAPITISSDIRIKSDDQSRTLHQMISSADHMFKVEDDGILTLGDKEQTAGELIIQNDLKNISMVVAVAEGILNFHNKAMIKEPDCSKGAINNSASVVNYDGGSILDSKNTAVINDNGGTVNITSGTISASSDVKLYTAGILSRTSTCTVNMTGGTITGYKGNSSCGIDNYGTLNLSGGGLNNNYYSIINKGTLYLSGNPSIPIGSDGSNRIVLMYSSPININKELLLAEGNHIGILCPTHSVGDTLLTGDSDAIKKNHNKFKLPNQQLSVSDEGKIVYSGEPMVLYVDAGYSSDDSDGSIDKPFKYLSDAVWYIDSLARVGSIYICSDIELNMTIEIKSDITLLNYGSSPHTISRSYGDTLFNIKSQGCLSLGNEDTGDDENPTLLLYGKPQITVTDVYCIICNGGSLKLYSGVKIYGNENPSDNYCEEAILNSGTFHMYGGIISDHKGSSGAGVYNNYGTFIMEGGKITNCTGSEAGAVYNDCGSFTMKGGVISNSTGSYAGAIFNLYGTFQMEDGEISNCTGNDAGAVSNLWASFTMSGGRMIDNTSDDGAGIYHDRGSTFHLSGDASIPAGATGGNAIFLDDAACIILDGNLNTGDKILLGTDTPYPGRRLLLGNESVLSGNYLKFELASSLSSYRLKNDGTLEYQGVRMDYYVDKDGNDDNEGTLTSPFATIKKAVAAIEANSGVGTIHICSDLELNEGIEIYGAVTLVNEGQAHTIRRSPGNMDSLFYVYGGVLELGHKELDGQAEVILLTIDGNNETSYDSIIHSESGLILHNGIAIQNGNCIFSGGAINSYGQFDMKGGVLQNNRANYGGALYVQYSYNNNIQGGSIRNNEAAEGGGIYLDCGTINQSGGSIADNKADAGGGIYIYMSNVLMSGGDISGNHQRNTAEGIVGEGVFMTGYSSFTVLQNARIAADNDVALVDIGLVDAEKPAVTVGGPLTGDQSVISLSKYISNMSTGYQGDYNVGDKILVPVKGYSLSDRDIAGFQMADSNYGINSQGLLAYQLKESWVTLSGGEEFEYTGSEIRPAVLVDNGTTTLVEGLDYEVSYENNLTVGTAKVHISGKGTYAGRVTKTFKIKASTYTIEANAGSNGTITPSGIVMVELFQDQSFSIVPEEGYTVAGVIVDGIPVGAVNSYTFTNVSSNHTISVTFKLIEVTPTPTPQPSQPTTPGDYSPAPTATPTPTPTLSPSPSTSITELEAKVSVTIEQNQQSSELNVSIEISADMLQTLNELGEGSGQTVVTIPIASEELTDLIQDDSFTEVQIGVTLPSSVIDNDNHIGTRLMLDEDILNAAREKEKDVTVSVKDESGKERYAWSFSGEALAASDEPVTDLDLSLNVQRAEDNQELAELLGTNSQGGSSMQNSLILGFGHHGSLPGQASVRVYVGNMGYSEGDRLYLYYYNSESGRLETLPYSSNYTVDRDGYITVNITHCSEYVLLPKQARADAIISLRDQISISQDEIILYLGSKKYGTAAITVNLPKTLELVKDLKDKTSGSAIGAVVITYKSTNSKVASVDSSGNIVAKKEGKADIIVVATLYSGKSKSFRIPVTVRKPYILITQSTDSMKLGESFPFKAEAFGLETKDIEWTTSKKSIVVIDKKTGRASAKSKGTDYVMAKIGDVSCKVKVVVK